MEKKEIQVVNSKFRESGSAENFGINLYFRNPDYNKVSLLQLNMMKNYYLMDDNQGRTFTISFSGGNPVTYTFPKGNYTRRTLAARLQTGMLNSNPPGYVVTCSIPVSTYEDNGYLVISFTVASGADPVIVLTFPDSVEPAEAMGFVRNTSYTFSKANPTATLTSLQSTQVQNLQVESALILHCDRVHDNFLQEILAFETSSYGTLIFQNPDPINTAKDLSPFSNSFHFYLTNEDNDLINPLNGAQVIFSLLFFKQTPFLLEKLVAEMLDEEKMKNAKKRKRDLLKMLEPSQNLQTK